MKKSVIIRGSILMAVLLASAVSSYGQQNPEQPKIKTVVVYEEKYDKLISKKLKESETTYDINGNILEDIQYKDGKVDKHFRYEYDSNNNKIKEIEYDLSGKVKEYSEYKYDRNLRIEKTVYDPQGKITMKKDYVYTTFN
jgi:antitoxin component YwqK of YwqJK toxin-antitoxin module